MHSISPRFAALAATLTAVANALDGIVVPTTVAANTAFNATFLDANSDQYRVFLSAALTGVNGPTCYLVNSTSLSSPVSITIPNDVGPSADYYSVGIADLTSSQGATYSNRFNLTGGTGNYTEYEEHLGGAPFWDANSLPCSSYACARTCAEAGYPSDLTDSTAYATMKSCILKCPGVSSSAASTTPALANATTATTTAEEALVTLSSGGTLTAVEMTVTSGSSTMTEAVIGGSMTLTLGGAEATVSNEAVSLAKEGVEVGGSTTVAFSSMVEVVTTVVTTTASATASTSSTTASTTAQSGGAARHEMAIAGMVGVAGIAALLL